MHIKLVIFAVCILCFTYFASPVSANCWNQCGVVGQREDGSDISWCWDTCDGGSYPTNDGYHQGSSEEASSRGWVDGNGFGHDGATGPDGKTAAQSSKPTETVSGGQGGIIQNCASGPPCASWQLSFNLEAIKVKNDFFFIPTGAVLDRLFASIDAETKQGILDGNIIYAAQNVGSAQQPVYDYVLARADILYPPTVQDTNGVPLGSGGSTLTYVDCRFCENGNQKSEQVVSGFCYPSEALCADYKLPEVKPIVEYRFPICQLYANSKNNRLATRSHPAPTDLAFSLTDAEGIKNCRLEFVDNIDGDGSAANDLQVVTCAVAVSNTVLGQDITIKSTSLPREGYGNPVWARRGVDPRISPTLPVDPSSCYVYDQIATPTYHAYPRDPYPIQVIGLPFTSPWIKVADGTYARSGNGSTPLVNYLPGFVEPFNSSDKDTSSSLPHFLTSTGAGISLGTVNVGSVATISTTNWKVDGYTSTLPNTPSSLFKEIMQKKTYQEYTQTSSAPNTLTLSDAITVIDTPTTYTLASLAFAGDKPSYTLIIKNGSNLGNLTIDTASLNPSGSPALLIIADTITLTPSVSTLGAVIIARTMNAGSGSELFIKGNLSLTTPLTHQRVRADSDDRKPTIFIEFSPDMYLSLLPSLGSTSREWSQIE